MKKKKSYAATMRSARSLAHSSRSKRAGYDLRRLENELEGVSSRIDQVERVSTGAAVGAVVAIVASVGLMVHLSRKTP